MITEQDLERRDILIETTVAGKRLSRFEKLELDAILRRIDVVVNSKQETE